MLIIQSGLDYNSLFGSNIITNNNFVFVSANGYNIYNGMIVIYYNNITISHENNPDFTIHSIIYSPEYLNTNFGLITSVNDIYLIVGGISYDIYRGVVYIYKFMYNKWIYIQKILNHNVMNHMSGFGDIIKITNNNLIIISDYSKSLYIYKLNVDTEQFYLSEMILKNDTLSNVYEQFSITIDNYDNIIISNYENNIFIKNLNDKSVTLFEHENDNECFYGSNLFLYEKKLFVSCSLYYPFTNIPEKINPKIYVYDIKYNLNNIISLHINQVIDGPFGDMYFGTHIDANNKILLISGTNNIYYYEHNEKWNYNKNYFLSNTYINYDYKLKLLNKNFIVTNYGYDELRGAIFMEKYFETNSEIQYISVNTIHASNNYIKIFTILFLLFGAAALTVIITLTCYLFVKCLTLITENKKDKKKEEEYSPYKVYSYVGYIETDDPLYYVDQPINNSQNYYFNPFPYQINTTINNDYQTKSSLSPIEKGIKPENDLKSDVGAEKISKETVVTYKTSTYDLIIKTYEDKIKPHMKNELFT